MPRIDYADLEDQVVAILRADADVGGASPAIPVLVEDETFPSEMAVSGLAVVFLERRDGRVYPAAASSRMQMRIRFSVWCYGFQLDNIETAARLRDDIVGKVELALMKKPTLNGKVTVSFIEGGDFETSKEGGGFLSGGEVVLNADAWATT